MISTLPYCADPFHYQRRQTRVVSVGDVPMGGTYPIRVPVDDDDGHVRY